MRIEFIVNGKTERLDVPGGKRLLDVLREDLHLTGAKEGCGEGECGACTVLMDGEAVHSCMVLAGQLTGHSVTTIEGLEEDGRLGVLQNAFVVPLCGMTLAVHLTVVVHAVGVLLNTVLVIAQAVAMFANPVVMEIGRAARRESV